MDKTERLLHMTEHPGQYSDEALLEILADEETRELYDTMRLCADAFEMARSPKPKARRLSLWRIAAAFVGLLMLSGIAYATIRIVRQSEQPEAHQPIDTTAVANSSRFTLHASLPTAPYLFENTPLDSLVTTLARYYNKVADIRSTTAHDLRLYYKWNPEDSLQLIVDDLNHFDRVSLTIDNDKLIAE